jgi:hypothetical protein
MEPKPLSQEVGTIHEIRARTPANREAIADYFLYHFTTPETHPAEREKSADFTELLSKINKDLAGFVEGYGGAFVELGTDHVLLIDFDELPDEKKQEIRSNFPPEVDLVACYVSPVQKIVTFRDFGQDSKLRFAQTLVHELLHAQAFQKIGQSTHEDPRTFNEILYENEAGQEVAVPVRYIQHGWGVQNRAREQLFWAIDEAVTEELATRFDHQYFGNYPELAQEIAVRKDFSDRVEFTDYQLNTAGLPPIATVGINNWQENGGYQSEVTVEERPYKNPRAFLKRLILDIFNKHREQFSEPEEIFNLFAKTALSGDYRPVVHLIRSTHGPDGFKRLGEKTTHLMVDPLEEGS